MAVVVVQDTVNGFYEITKRDVKEYEMAITAKDREMELMEENHRVEVRVREVQCQKGRQSLGGEPGVVVCGGCKI